jgi:hypothetical protein
MTTRTAFAVQHVDVTGKQHAPARIAYAPAQVEVFAMQEIRLVESVQPFEDAARHQHQRTGDGFRFDNMIGHRAADIHAFVVALE